MITESEPPAVNPNPDPAQGAQNKKDLRIKDNFDPQFELIYNSFKVVAGNVEDNRANRDLIVDVAGLQAQGKLRANETYIAQRIIDTNIARAMPPHVAYLTQSRRLGLFIPEDINLRKNTTGLEVLETEFQRVMTYQDWVLDYVRWADGAELNGFDFLSVCFDPEMPGHVAVEHVGTKNLLFDKRVKSVQQSPMVARVYEITVIDLYEMSIDYEFLPGPTAQLEEKLTASQNQYAEFWPEANLIYQVFFKQEGKVWACWYSKELKLWLTDPAPFWNGVSEQVMEMPKNLPPGQLDIQPVPVWKPVTEVEYPFYPYVHRVTENPRIADTVGRADLDFYLQEAACSLYSALINGCVTASNTMWSPKTPNPEVGAAPKQLTMIIEDGAIWNQPMEAFNAPWPDSTMPKVLEMLRSSNAEDTNQISFATNNRKDTRKTATEIDAAEKQDTIMSSVTVTLFGGSLRSVFNPCWRIQRSEALQNKIVFAPLPDGSGNDMQLLTPVYDVIPAGTIDYVERMERISSMQEDMQIIGPTAAGPAFMAEYIKAKYPNIATQLIAPLEQAQAAATGQADGLAQKVLALQELLKAAIIDPKTGKLEPEWAQHSQEIEALLSNPGAQAAPATGIQPAGAQPAAPSQPAAPQAPPQ